MRLVILKFKDWKLRSKLLLLTVITLLSIVILSMTSSFFFNTSRTLNILLNGVRVHQNLMQSAVDDLYHYKIEGKENYLQSSAANIDKANHLIRELLNIRNEFDSKSNQQIAKKVFNDFPEVFNNELANAELMVHRLRIMITIFQSSDINSSRGLVIETLELTEEIKKDLLEKRENLDFDITHKQLVQIQEHYSGISFEINELTHKINSILIWAMIFIALGLGITIMLLARYISNSITKPVKQMVNNFGLIATGNFRNQLNIDGKDEIGELAQSFKIIQQDFQNVVDHTRKVANGDLSVSLIPKSKEDELTISLNQMVKNLKDSKAINDETIWFRSGINQLNDELQGDMDLKEVSKKAIQYMTEFLRAELGAIYVFDEEKEHLTLTASIGIPDKNQFKNIQVGHGLVGQVAETKKLKHVKNLPANYFSIFSATGEIQPSNIVLVPLVFDKELWGVMELAAIKTFSESEIDFIKAVREGITVKIASTIARLRLETLLETTQKQASELQVQQEELRVANEELAEHTKILTENEKKLQVQQEELRVANEELEERTNQLELQKEEITQKNESLSSAHNKLEGKARELEQASQYKSDFLANMSHELRTPLNSLLILSSMLAKNKNGNLTEEDVESVEIINKSGKDLLQLINEILDLSKIEAGKMNIHFESVSPSDIKSEILMDFKHQAEKKKLDFSVDIADNFPHLIETDQLRLNQIVKNLLSNAFKFTTIGSIKVKMEKMNGNATYWRKELEEAEVCAISVEDTGVGIPPEKKEAIFEAFQQADGSTSRKYGGTGLGLSISKELARMLGGEIHLESEISKGSTFTLLIPSKQNGASSNGEISNNQVQFEEEIKEEIAPTLPQFIDDDRDIPHKGSTIVVIHPHEKEATALYYQIHNSSFHALVAQNVEDALQLIEAHQPSAIIIGIELIMEHGEEVLQLLSDHPMASQLPMHIVNPIDGIIDKEQADIITVNSFDITKVINKMKSELFTEAKKILIIEDNFTTRKVIRDLLAPTHVQIDECSSGEEAYQTIKSGKYDCMILDLGLPDYSGNELLKKLSENKINIPNTIIYTGKDLSREEHRELSKFTNSIILKGIKSDERLMDEVSLFLHQVATQIPDNPKVNITEIDDSIFNGKRILVVDDEIRNIFALGKMLEDKEMEVFEAENGQIAIDVLKEHNNIDLVLMDIMMPEMDGYEAMNVIRKTPEIQEVPIICLTAKAMKDDYEKAIAAGANDYLSKPIDENKLFAMLKIWLYN